MARTCTSDMSLALAGLAVAALVTGCSSKGEPTKTPEPEEKPAVAGFAHDGAVPIAVVNSFEDTRRSIVDGKGGPAAATTCSLLTPALQEATVEKARAEDLVGKGADCGEAMEALAERVPKRIESFTVTRAEEDETEIVVVRVNGTADAYTLTGSMDDNVWLIDDVEPTEAPEPEPVPEAPVGEILPSMKKDRDAK